MFDESAATIDRLEEGHHRLYKYSMGSVMIPTTVAMLLFLSDIRYVGIFCFSAAVTQFFFVIVANTVFERFANSMRFAVGYYNRTEILDRLKITGDTVFRFSMVLVIPIAAMGLIPFAKGPSYLGATLLGVCVSVFFWAMILDYWLGYFRSREVRRRK